MWWLAACDGREGRDPQPPEIEATVSAPSEAAPLARALHVEADGPVTVRVAWDDVSFGFPAGGAVQDHVLIGFRPGMTHEVRIEAERDGAVASTTVEVVTDPLPAHFPDAVVTGEGGEPGHTLVSMRSTGAPWPAEVAAVYDEDGEIRWYLGLDDVMQDVREVNGELWVLTGSAPGSFRRYGWDGVLRDAWTIGEGEVEPEHARILHHDAAWVPGVGGREDRIVALGRAALPVAEYPADYDDPDLVEARVVADDVVLLFELDGTLVREQHLSGRWPLRRIGFDSLSETVDGAADWAHANAIVWDDEEVLVSLRHQDALVKLRPDGSIRWILANEANWPPDLAARRLQPVGDGAGFRWPYHQHGPSLGPVGPDGTRILTVFDNGNHQASPYTDEVRVDEPHSRVVQYTIDEDALTVRQDWAFDAPEGGALYSEAVGDADPQPGGTVLSTWGLLDALPDGTTNGEAGLGQHSVRILELDPAPAASGQPVRQVWSLSLSTEATVNASGWTAYRAQRIAAIAGRDVDPP